MSTDDTPEINRWLHAAGAVGLVVATGALGLLGWMASSVHSMTVSVAEIRKELDLTKPAEVLSAVKQSELQALKWQNEVSQRLVTLEQTIDRNRAQ